MGFPVELDLMQGTLFWKPLHPKPHKCQTRNRLRPHGPTQFLSTAHCGDTEWCFQAIQQDLLLYTVGGTQPLNGVQTISHHLPGCSLHLDQSPLWDHLLQLRWSRQKAWMGLCVHPTEVSNSFQTQISGSLKNGPKCGSHEQNSYYWEELWMYAFGNSFRVTPHSSDRRWVKDYYLRELTKGYWLQVVLRDACGSSEPNHPDHGDRRSLHGLTELSCGVVLRWMRKTSSHES